MLRKIAYSIVFSMGILSAESLNTNKNTYTVNENIQVSFGDLRGANNDWVAIYPANASNDFGNIIKWQRTGARENGTVGFQIPNQGSFNARVFYGAQHVVNSQPFTINAGGGNNDGDNNGDVKLETNKNSYQPNEQISVSYNNASGNPRNWIAIYRDGTNNDFGNIIQWQGIGTRVNGTVNFQLPRDGMYNARLFTSRNHIVSTAPFRIGNDGGGVDNEPARVLYDDFEDGIDPRWSVYFGKPMQLLNVGVLDRAVGHKERQVVRNGQHSLRTFNSDGLAQSSGYIFNFENPAKKFKYLEVDMRVGESSHRFAFGVKIKTANGDRRIEFASWLNHTLPNGQQIIRGPYGNVLQGHRQAFTQDGYLHIHPGPSDYLVGTSDKRKHNDVDPMPNSFIHYKIDIAAALKVLEPNNEFLGMLNFSTSGGDYDNLALSTH